MTTDPDRDSKSPSEFLVDPTTLRHCELTVIMPVYNEQDSLPGCAESWLSELDRLGIDHRLLLIDDGSSDGTADVLADLRANDRVLAISKPNEGHGPTILRGYRVGVRSSDWVFQVDSDDEIPASSFPEVWDARSGVDAVFGVRVGREQPVDRRFISRSAAMTSRLLFRSKVTDVNVPYRLVKSEALEPIVDALPDDTFAPNVVISGALGRDDGRFVEVEVPHQHRQAGQVSIVGWGAMRAALRSFTQTVRLARAV